MAYIYCCNSLDEKNDKMYIKIDKKATLSDLRVTLEKFRNIESLFFLTMKNNYFSKDEEKKLSVFDYYKGKIVYFTDVPDIKLFIKNEFLCSINFENIALNVLRNNLGDKINPKFKFFFRDAFILDEENFTVFEICNKNQININQISDEIFNKLIKRENKEKVNTLYKKKNFNYSNCNSEKNKKNEKNLYYEKESIKLVIVKENNIKILRDNDIKEEIKSDKVMPKEKRRYIAIFDNEKKEDFKYLECYPDDTIKKLRKRLPTKYQNYLFLVDDFPIINEENLKVNEIVRNNKIYLKTNKININNLLNQYKKIKKNNNYDYYLYPNSPFDKEEEKQCISILLIGETGSGKTTLLNCMINSILKINYSDNNRVLLVDEEAGENYLSQTKEVNIYHIKSHNSFPPIKIIDTPGFGDTSGHNFDKKIAKMIFEKFKEIKELNSVCIISKFNEGRFNANQRYIFNYIINLFGKDMIENFMVLFTFCDIGEVISKQCFENENSPFFKIINKIKEPWYLKFNNSGFFSENKNEIAKDYFKMGAESFGILFNKLKSLKKIKLELSSEVNNKREKIDNIFSYIENEILNIINLMSYQYSYSDKDLIFYYCPKCKFFSDSQKCVFGNHNMNQEEKEFKHILLGDKKIYNDKLYFKFMFQIYCNLFRLEYLIKEYNNITLMSSHETIKDYFSRFIREKKINNSAISNQIMNIKNNYEEYRNKFFSHNNKNTFPRYLFSILTK